MSACENCNDTGEVGPEEGSALWVQDPDVLYRCPECHGEAQVQWTNP